MRPRKSEHDQLTINAFKIHKVLTIVALSALLQLSLATVRRRLKEWDALSSYNHSGRYYTLPSIPKFNKKGLWEPQGALFSKHGTMINTIIHFPLKKMGLLANGSPISVVQLVISLKKDRGVSNSKTMKQLFVALKRDYKSISNLGTWPRPHPKRMVAFILT